MKPYDTTAYNALNALKNKLHYHKSVLTYVEDSVAMIENLMNFGFELPITAPELAAWADEHLFMKGYQSGRDKGFGEGVIKGREVATKETYDAVVSLMNNGPIQHG